MAEYSAAEHFNNPGRQRVPLVEFTLPLEPTATRPAGGNYIHKTTSETLRLTDQLHPNQVGPSSTVDIKKTSSFQITSVRVSSSISNDGEDDSCGEVDDTQTEPSEVGSHNQIDVEEDIETGGDGPPVMYVSNVPVSLAQQQVNEGSALKLEDKDHGLQRRFRVVKIESAEPFKRGRWLCMDFLDQPSIQPILTKDEPGSGTSSSGSLSDHISAEDVQHHATFLHQPNPTIQSISSGAVLNPCNQQASSSIHVVPHSLPASAASVNYPPAQQQLLQQPMYQTQSSVPLVYPPVASVTTLLQPTAAPIATSNAASLAIPLISSQSTSSVTAGSATLPGLSSNVAQPFIQQPQPVPPGLLQQQQPMAGQSTYTASAVASQQQQQYVTPASGIQPGMTAQHLPPQQPAQPVVAQIPVMGQQNLISVQASSSSNIGAPAPHPLAPTLIQPSTSIPTQSTSMHPVVLLPPSASLQQQSQSTPVVPIHGPPPGLIPQHPHPPIGLQSQQQQQQQQQQPGNQGQPTFAEVVASAPVQSLPSTQHLQQHAPQPTTSVPVQPIGIVSTSSMQPPEVVMQQPSVQQMQPMQQTHIQQSGSVLMQPQQQQQQHHQQQQPTLVQQTATPHAIYGNSSNQTLPTAVMSVATSIQPQVQLIMAAPSTLTTAVVSSNVGGEAAAMTAVPHAPGVLNKSQSLADDGHTGASTDDHTSASGSSTVAIDNKIEQAMDLVKSHLMFAVREEVEVLKERIDVLMERIAFLESENQILRAAATQETLAQIAQLEATFPVSGNDNIGGGGSVSVVGVSSSIGAIVNTTITSTTTTPSTTTSCTSSQLPSGTSPAP